MIRFKSIRWKNLLSTGNEFTEIQLDRAQTTLIVGENGAGKSTFLEALTFSLFGKPFRKVNKPQLVNSMTRKNLVVEVEFSIGPNSYKIVRGLKPNFFDINASLAAFASSLARITLMTSSMTFSALRRPSRMWSTSTTAADAPIRFSTRTWNGST